MSKDSGMGFFTGLMIGAVIGLAVGFLYAPQPGSETRRNVKEKISAARQDASKATNRIKERVQRRMEEMQQEE